MTHLLSPISFCLCLFYLLYALIPCALGARLSSNLSYGYGYSVRDPATAPGTADAMALRAGALLPGRAEVLRVANTSRAHCCTGTDRWVELDFDTRHSWVVMRWRMDFSPNRRGGGNTSANGGMRLTKFKVTFILTDKTAGKGRGGGRRPPREMRLVSEWADDNGLEEALGLVGVGEGVAGEGREWRGRYYCPRMVIEINEWNYLEVENFRLAPFIEEGSSGGVKDEGEWVGNIRVHANSVSLGYHQCDSEAYSHLVTLLPSDQTATNESQEHAYTVQSVLILVVTLLVALVYAQI